jgi:NAD(P) transhydrogenase subunit beta
MSRCAAGLSVRTIAPDDAAVLLGYAGQVVIVPGYGLALAQAQHVARELGELLMARGATSVTPSTPSPGGCGAHERAAG